MVPKFHYFFKLPAEIRTMIYEFALCPGIIYVWADEGCSGDHILARKKGYTAYRDDGRDGSPMPGPAHDYQGNRRLRYADYDRIKETTSPIFQNLLRGVSRTVQAEASAVLYGPKNLFVLPCGPYDYPRTSAHNYCYDAEVPDIPPFSRVSYTFDMRDAHWDMWEIRENLKVTEKDDIAEYAAANSPDASQFDMTQRLHMESKFRIGSLWEKRCEIMREKLVPMFLQIDVEECYCPLGCCRMVEDVFEAFGPFEKGSPPTVEVIGIKDEDEATMVKVAIYKKNFVGNPNHSLQGCWRHCFRCFAIRRGFCEWGISIRFF